jgi:hypothetical protein
LKNEYLHADSLFESRPSNLQKQEDVQDLETQPYKLKGFQQTKKKTQPLAYAPSSSYNSSNSRKSNEENIRGSDSLKHGLNPF